MCISLNSIPTWRGVRVVDGDALEMRFGETQRGFESPPLRFNFCLDSLLITHTYS